MLNRLCWRICEACSVCCASRPRISVSRCAVSSQSVVPPPLGRPCLRSLPAVAADCAALAPVPRAGASAASSASQCFCPSLPGIGLVHPEQCCLTLRSSGLAPAWHPGREAERFIIGLAARAPRRRSPLSSNVRPHTQPPCIAHRSGPIQAPSPPSRASLPVSPSPCWRSAYSVRSGCPGVE